MKCRFEIVGLSGIDGFPHPLKVNGKKKYMRLLIKRVKEEDIKQQKDVALLMEYGKKFVIMGNKNAITYKEIFPYIKNNQLWNGYTSLNGGRWMVMPNDIEIQSDKVKVNSDGEKILNVAGVCWFTNLDHNKRHEELDLYKRYSPEEYPKYDNYDAINVDKVCEIPMDYEGIMGVPITFLDKYCPTQFEIIGIMSGVKDSVFVNGNDGRAKFYVNDKGVYARILIKRVF